jgi:arginine exporter protein ArgO
MAHPTHQSLSEQLIPMLGLTALEHTLKPETTLEKIVFLVENGVTRAHRPTSFVSACALASLVILRMLKASLRRYKWVTRVPEVLIVVIVSTRTICALALLALWLNICSSLEGAPLGP